MSPLAATAALLACLVMANSCSTPAAAQNRKLYPLPNGSLPGSMGVNIHFTDPQPGEMEQLAAAGFKWIRMDFHWAATEREKGRYDFSAYDRLQAALRKHGIRPIYILDYGNDLYQEGAPRSPEARAAFARWAAAAVSHFRDQGILWEMWNEPNIFFWRPKPNVDEYTALALEVGKAIRAVAPDEWYIGPATSGIDLTFLEGCFRAGLLRYWDAVSVHPYRSMPPETSTAEIRKLRSLVDRYAPKGKHIPLISGEWGYSELYSGLDLEKQGKFLPREMLINAVNGLILSIWYDWHDDGTDPKEVEHHFGTVYPDYRPKPAYHAAQTLAKMLEGTQLSKRLALQSPEDYCLLFAGGGKLRLAVWTTGSKPHPVTLPTGPGRYRVVSHTGDSSEAEAGEDGLRLELTDSPQYVEPLGASPLLDLAARWRPLPAAKDLSRKDNLAWALPALSAPKGSSARVTLTSTLRKQPLKLGAAPSPAQARSALARVVDLYSRDGASQTLRATLAGPLGSVSQEVVLTPSEPLRVTLLAPTKGTLPVRVDNPTGAAFSGRVRLAGIPGAVRSLTFAKGETERVVAMPVEKGEAGQLRAQVVVEERVPPGPFRAVLKTPALRVEMLEDFAEFAAGSPPEPVYRLVPDGDAKVESKIEMSVEQPPAGLPADFSRALRIHYEFKPGWKFIRLVGDSDLHKPLEGKPKSLGMWVHGDGSGDILRMRFTDSTGQTFQPDGGTVDWRGWRYVTFPLTGESAGRWGGAEDGVIHYPIHLDSLFLVDSPGGRGGSGTLHIAGISLVREAG